MDVDLESQSRWGVIVNPVAGSGKGLSDYPIISKYFRDNKVIFDSVFTEKKYHAIELTVEFINKGYRKLIVVGGDGTFNEVVNGIFHQKSVETTDIKLAVIAVGTGNDWIRMHGVPKKYNEAIKAIVDGKTFLQDVCKIGFYEAKVHQTRYMANMAGIGFDAMVNRQYNRMKQKGYKTKLLYIYSMLYTLTHYRSVKMDVRIDGNDVVDEKILTGALAIGKFNGGGMIQAPLAIADDGLLDITIIKKMSNLNVLRYAKYLFNGEIYNVPGSMFFRGREVTISSEKITPIEIDGEAMGYTPFDFKIISKVLKVIIK
ncbi:MAG: diacylglycerol kinase family lipid kinase [Rikenellaceae bacterium]